MTHREKAELLKETIRILYCEEGRTKAYIRKTLEIDYRALNDKLEEWRFQPPTSKITPSVQKFINKNRQLIKARLDKDFNFAQIADELGTNIGLIKQVVEYDEVLQRALEEKENRNRKNELIKQELYESIEDLEGEIWKPIENWEMYQVSNKGRIKRCDSRSEPHLIKLCPNKNNGRIYAMVSSHNVRKNLQVARLVGFAFLSDSHSEEKNTINHKDGDVSNNCVENLEWVSQSVNNKHSYSELNRPVSNKRRYIFDKILYQDKYEFSTIAAFARFLNKSETQIRRYLDNPEKYDIKLINN